MRISIPLFVLLCGAIGGGCATGGFDFGDTNDAGSRSQSRSDARIRTTDAAPDYASDDEPWEPFEDQSCSGVTVPDRGGFQRRVVLTFDDGPNPNTTPDVLAVLRAHSVPATFFILGSRVVDARTRELVAEIEIDPLFELGNHSVSHPRDPFLDQMPPDQLYDEIDGTTQVIEAAGGTPRYFRFPFGRATCETATLVRELGYRVVGWHIDSADWCFARGQGTCDWESVPPEYRSGDFLGYVRAQLAKTRGGVILLHDIHRFTADHLNALIEQIQADGYTLTSLDDFDTLPLLNGRAIPDRFIGDACRSAGDCRFGATAFCHGTGFCSTECEGLCPDREGWARTFCIEDPEGPSGASCVSTSSDANHSCADAPGTTERRVTRFQGPDSPDSSEELVCAPF